MRPDLTGIVRAGDGIIVGQACAEPQTLVEALVEQRASFSGARVFLGVNYSGILRPEHADHLRLSAYCGSGHNRALADAGVLDIHPHPYSRLGPLIREKKIPCDILLLQVSPPNARGEYSLGLAADYLIAALASARAVIGEVNEKVPWTHTEKLLRKEDFALLVESSREPAPAPASRLGDTERKIARNAATFIPERATLEFGLGALPEAICAALAGRKGLAIHSGTVGDGVVHLLAEGSVDTVTAAMLIGSRALFDAARENPRIRLRSSEYTHDPRVLAGIERFVAVNTAVEVDLTGQVNGEVARGSYLGAVGGALDFVRAANQSPGGISLTLISASRIVENLSGPVSTPRSEVGVVISELGAADLRGCSLTERKKRMKAITKQ